MDKVFINKPPAVKEFPIYNAGTKPVAFMPDITGPSYIKVETPKVLANGEQGVIKITYDARARKMYGFLSDNVEIHTDDSSLPVKSFSVYATSEEFFPVLSPAAMSKAPALHIDMTAIDFGRLNGTKIVEREVSIRNTGQNELDIRDIQSNCSCLTVSVDPWKIKAGGEGKLKLSFNPQGRIGVQQKAVTIYSSDPKNPVQRVTLTGYIDNP
jgi:Protein of unknown function (DUF1573)